MIALIDGDLVAYRCAASAENEQLDWQFVSQCRLNLYM